ncbi:MAG: helix-turn-helix domain-containing protein [Halobacteriales archaeon]
METQPVIAPEANSGPPMEDRNLRLLLEIEREGPCGLDTLDGDVVDVDVRFDAGNCNVDAAVRDPENGEVSTWHFSEELCQHCPGEVFAEHGLLPRYLEINDGSFVVETFVSDTETVAELVSGIRDRSSRVSVRSMVSTETSQFREDRSVDLSVLTMKQREAVTQAKEMGYYDPDTDVTLEDVADRLGISPSALSQRLQRAEGNVLRQISCECACSDTSGSC